MHKGNLKEGKHVKFISFLENVLLFQYKVKQCHLDVSTQKYIKYNFSNKAT